MGSGPCDKRTRKRPWSGDVTWIMIENKNCSTATPGGQVSTSKARVVSTTAGGNNDKTTRTPVDKSTSVPASGNETTTDNLDATSSLLNTTTGESTKVYTRHACSRAVNAGRAKPGSDLGLVTPLAPQPISCYLAIYTFLIMSTS